MTENNIASDDRARELDVSFELKEIKCIIHFLAGNNDIANLEVGNSSIANCRNVISPCFEHLTLTT